MDMVYRLEYESKKGGCNVNFYEDKSSAVRAFRRKKKKKELNTIWADLFETDYDDINDEYRLIASFERERMEVFDGIMMFTGRMIDERGLI